MAECGVEYRYVHFLLFTFLRFRQSGMHTKCVMGKKQLKIADIWTTIKFSLLQCIVTKVQTRKQMGTLSLYKAVMYLECSPFLEKERDGWRPIAPMCPFVAFFIRPWLAGKCPFVTMHCILAPTFAKLRHLTKKLPFRFFYYGNPNLPLIWNLPAAK